MELNVLVVLFLLACGSMSGVILLANLKNKMEEVIEEGGELNDMNEEAETLTETFNFEADDQIDLNEFEAKEKQEEIEPKEPMDVYSKRLLISNIIVFIFYSIQTLILVYLIHFFF